MAGMDATLALLGGATASKKNRVGRPTRASMGMGPDDIHAWEHFRACVVLETFERARAEGKSRVEARLCAVSAWKGLYPAKGKINPSAVDAIIAKAQPEDRPAVALRVIRTVERFPETETIGGKLRLTGRWIERDAWTFREDQRPDYPKRGTGRKPKLRFSKRFT